MTSYTDRRAVIVTHATAAAAAVDPTWSDVAPGFANLNGKCVRVYWGGETVPVKMGAEDGNVLNGRMVGDRVVIVAAWPLSNLSTEQAAAIDAEMWAWKHELRTRLQGDATLGGTCTDSDLEYVEPDVVVNASGTRFATVEAEFLLSYTEYPISA